MPTVRRLSSQIMADDAIAFTGQRHRRASGPSEPATLPMEHSGTRDRRLFVVGLGTSDTGLCRVSTLLAEELRTRWSVTLFQHNRVTAPTSIDGVSVIGMRHSLNDPALDSHLADALQRANPDVVLFVDQPWKYRDVLQRFRTFAPRSKLAVYMAVEGRPVGDRIQQALMPADLCVTYTDYVRRHLVATAPQPIDAIAIPHGLEPCRTLRYPPPINRRMVRQALFPEWQNLVDLPMILNANRLYPRKRIDLTLEGFAIALASRPANLYLHLPGLTRYEERRLETQIYALGIERHVFWNLLNPLGETVPFHRLVDLMRAADIGLTTAMGEGWGLGTFEHAATGAAQVVPDHSSFRENWGGAATLFSAPETFYMEHECAEMYVSRPEDIAEALTSLLGDPAQLSIMSAQARAHALKHRFSWSAVAKAFDVALSRLIEPAHQSSL